MSCVLFSLHWAVVLLFLWLTEDISAKQSTSMISPTSARERTEPVPSHPQDNHTFQTYMYDSKEEARKLFECLIHPVVTEKFFALV